MFWHYTKSACFHSVTMALHYVVFAAGVALEALFQFPDVASSVGLAQYVPTQWAGWYTIAIAGLTLAARLRSIFWKKEHDHGLPSELAGPDPRGS